MAFTRVLAISVSVAALTLTACGGGGGGGGGTSSGGGSGNTNSAPRFTSPTSFSFREDEQIIFTLEVADADGDQIAITDDTAGDGAYFQVDPSNGVVSLNTQAVGDSFLNFENPLDVNNDNIYEQTITLSDGKTSIEQVISVEIINVYEPGSCERGNTISIPEGTTEFVYNIQKTDVDAVAGNFLDIAVGHASNGTDQEEADFLAKFGFDTETGELVLNEAFDYESNPNFYMAPIPLETRYGTDDGRVDCSISILVTDAAAVPASGFSISTPEMTFTNSKVLGDLDGDGLDELWVEVLPQDSFATRSDRYIVFGSQINSLMTDNTFGSTELSLLESLHPFVFRFYGVFTG